MTVDEILAKFQQEQKELELEEQNTVKHCEQCDAEIFEGGEIGQMKKNGNWLEVCGSCFKRHKDLQNIANGYSQYLLDRLNATIKSTGKVAETTKIGGITHTVTW